MSKLIKGTHHVALKCDSEALLQQVIAFYTETLGLELIRASGGRD